jgi:hypothetical protein
MAKVWPDALVRELAERRAVLFLGAGFSRAAASLDNKQMPSWSGLIKKLADELPKKVIKNTVISLLSKNNYLDAAQIIWDTLPEADLRQVIVETFAKKLTSIPVIYKNIVGIDPQIIVTTNYDKFIEKSLEALSGSQDAYNTCWYSQNHALDDIRSPQRAILKVHGCVTQPNDIILTRMQYFNARRNNPAFFNTLSSVLTINTTPFLGYSLSDPDIQLVLEYNNISAPSRNPHYALVEKIPHESIRTAMQKTYNIHFIEYPTGQHEKMIEYFDDLEVVVRQFRNERGIP